MTALTRAARAAPDGYTIAIGNSGTNAAAYTIYPDIKHAPADFAPIGLVAKTLPVIAVKNDLPAKNARRIHRLRQGRTPARSPSAMPASARRTT